MHEVWIKILWVQIIEQLTNNGLKSRQFWAGEVAQKNKTKNCIKTKSASFHLLGPLSPEHSLVPCEFPVSSLWALVLHGYVQRQEAKASQSGLSLFEETPLPRNLLINSSVHLIELNYVTWSLLIVRKVKKP